METLRLPLQYHNDTAVLVLESRRETSAVQVGNWWLKIVDG